MSVERTIDLLVQAPGDRALALLVRHARRFELEDPPSAEVSLTPQGWLEARELGRAIGSRLRRVAHSPLLRCEQTAAALWEGSGLGLRSTEDRKLGGPGLFVDDERIASESFARLGVTVLLGELLAGRPVPGFVAPERGARDMIEHLVASITDAPAGVHVFVTHDALLAPTLGWLFGDQAALPDYLAALLLWIDDGGRVRARHAQLETSLDRSAG